LACRPGRSRSGAFFAEGQYKIVLDLSLNGHVLLFTLTVAVMSGLAFGVLPALRASGFDPGAGLQSGSRGIAGSRRSMRLGRALVITQVALCTVLLAGAAMFIRTLSQLESVDLGFNPEGVLTMEVTSERQAFGAPQWAGGAGGSPRSHPPLTRSPLSQLGHDESDERPRPRRHSGRPRVRTTH
jgi:hypothetical protein